MSPSAENDTGFGTRAIHAGQEPDPVTGAVIPPISLSTTFKQSAAGVHNVRLRCHRKARRSCLTFPRILGLRLLSFRQPYQRQL